MERRDTLNLLSLYGSLGINAFLNLFLIAYLARALEPEAWGAVLLAQTVGFWLAMVPEFGFSLSAGRAIARESGDVREISRITWTVNRCKVLLCLSLLPLAGLALIAIPVFRANEMLLIGALAFGIAQGFDPVWFFQGIERQYIYAGLSTLARLAVAGLMVLLVNSPADSWMVMFICAL
jgi:polysaccharide transporter, PST family